MKLATKAIVGITVTLIAAIVFITLAVRPALESFRDQPDFSKLAQAAVDVYETGGKKAYRRWQRRQRRQMQQDGEPIFAVLVKTTANDNTPLILTNTIKNLPNDIKPEVQKIIDRLASNHVRQARVGESQIGQKEVGQKQVRQKTVQTHSLAKGWWLQTYLVKADTAAGIMAADYQYYWVVLQRISPRDRQWLVWLSIAVLALFLLTAAGWAAWLLVKPLRQMSAVHKQFGEGDLAIRIDEKIAKRTDELGDLATNFNTAAQQIEWFMASHKQLLYDVSHEIRSPLARIQLAVELLLEAKMSQELGDNQARHWEENIDTEIQNLNGMVEQLLTQARMERADAHEQFSLSPLDIRAAVERLIALWQPQAQQKNIQLIFSDPLNQSASNVDFETNDSLCNPPIISEQQPSATNNFICLANAILLERLVNNLVSNALKFSTSGDSVNVDITATHSAVYIRFLDQAGGMTDSDLSRIFDTFYSGVNQNNGRDNVLRDKNISERNSENSNSSFGLGLSIAKRATELMGGQLTAENTRSDIAELSSSAKAVPQSDEKVNQKVKRHKGLLFTVKLPRYD